MTIKSRDRLAAEALARHLTGLPEVLEFRSRLPVAEDMPRVAVAAQAKGRARAFPLFICSLSLGTVHFDNRRTVCCTVQIASLLGQAMKREIIRVEPLSIFLERWKAPTSAVT